MTEVYIEKRRRGFFGWIFMFIFIVWNFLNVMWMYELTQLVGADLTLIFWLFVWAIGSVITGILAVVFRGGKTVSKHVK